MLRKIKLVVTRHARERAEQFQLPISKLVWLFWTSEKGETPPNAHRYTENVDNTIYRRNGSHVMIVRMTQDKYSGKDIYLLITIYNQEMDLPTQAFMWR